MNTKKLFTLLIALMMIWVIGSLIWAPKAQVVRTDIADMNGAIQATDTFSGGVHIISGKVMAPTPCFEVRASTTVAESYPEQVTINIDMHPMAEAQVCAQVVTPIEFTTTASASKDAKISIRLNGAALKLNMTTAEGGSAANTDVNLNSIIPEGATTTASSSALNIQD